jgi:subtilisin family serine protease
MKTKTKQLRMILLGILSTVTSIQLSAQNIPKSKKINQEISVISSEKKASKRLRGNGLEQIGSESNKSFTTVSKNWIVKDDAVQIIANCSDDVNGLIQELKSLETSNIKTYGKTVTGFIPMKNVSKLENCKHLRSAVPSYKPKINSGRVNSQGDRAMFSENLRKRYNVDGTNIKIGILSDSYNVLNGADEDVKNGELPGLENPFGYTKPVQVLSEAIDKSVIDEGRAMAQLIHDVAPGAELFFYSANNGYFDYADGIKLLQAKGCNIIVDDVLYLADPMFQDGLIAQAVEEVSKKGVLYFAAAGNQSNKGFEAKYKEFSITNDDQVTNNFFDFGNEDIAQTISVPPFATIRIGIQWDAPSILAGTENPTPELDLDIFLVDPSISENEVVAFSNNDNVQMLDNTEIVEYTNQTDSFKDLEIIIFNSLNKKPSRIKYIDFTDSIIFKENVNGINAATCVGHRNSKSTITVGANDASITPAFGKEYTLENYSSVGGGFGIILDKNGKSIPEEFRMKPDLVGPDATSTTVPDFGVFFGTSAAAPHVAAVAALIKQSNMNLTRDQILKALIKSAEDMDNPYTEGFDKGFDFATGNGFVIADKALAITKKIPTIYRYELINAVTQKVHITAKKSGVLNDGDSVDLSEVEQGALLNIKALAVNGLKNEDFTTFLRYRGANNEIGGNVDKIEPYSFFGDKKGVFNSWSAKTGEYELRGAASLASDGSVPDGGYDIYFTVVNTAFVDLLQLVSGVDDQFSLQTIVNGSKIDLNRINANFKSKLNIRAKINNDLQNEFFSFDPKIQIGEVKFKLTGPQNYDVNDILGDKSFNFNVFSDKKGNPIPWNPIPQVGKYKIEIQPLARKGDLNTAGKIKVINFEITDSSIPAIASRNASGDISEGTLLIAPNPAVGESISIQTEKNEPLQDVQVYDSNGMLVFSKTGKFEGNKINLSHLNGGFYFVKANNIQGTVYNGKLIINKK